MDPRNAAPNERRDGARLYDRRAITRAGLRAFFAAPVVSTFLAEQAYAANYSCYGESVDKACGDTTEPCCPGLTCQDIGGEIFRCRP